MSNHFQTSVFQLYACLPFIEIGDESAIQMGPVLFWPSSKFKRYLNKNLHDTFQEYLDKVNLSKRDMTCVSISDDIPESNRDIVLIDSIYLLYFTCTFRNLYYNIEVPHFRPFKKIIPASENFIKARSNWDKLEVHPNNQENVVCVTIIDQEICHGLGIAIEAAYGKNSSISKETTERYKRLIRAIRYFVDCFFERFVNLIGHGLDFSDKLFEPEDVVFLASSFEALLDINFKDPAPDLKHKLRPMLHLKYSRPLEIFWKWVDGFYDLQKKIIHGGDNPDPIFRGNKNFELPYIYIGFKLFIYTVYYMLFKYKLIGSNEIDVYNPPDFKWIHPQELILFFWTEDSLLRKLSLAMLQSKSDPIDQHRIEAIWLSSLYKEIFERYFQLQAKHAEGVIHFFPSLREDLEREAKIISDQSTQITILSNDFLTCLQQRVS